MSVYGICMVKDEADIIEATVTHMLGQLDGVLIADNNSDDGTWDILSQLLEVNPGRLHLKGDPDPAYYQSQKMSALAAEAAEMGAEWVIPFDADELWVSQRGRIADVLRDVEEPVARAPILNYVATGADPADENPVKRIGWRQREALGLPKVACRAQIPVTIDAGNHGAHYPDGMAIDLLEVRHFPYRSAEQFVRKARNGAAAYAQTDLPFSTGQHWREYGRLIDEGGDEAGEAWFREHFWVYNPQQDPSLVYDPVS